MDIDPDDQPSGASPDGDEPRRVFSDDLILSGKPTPADYALAAKHIEQLETSEKRPSFLPKFNAVGSPQKAGVGGVGAEAKAKPSRASTESSWFDGDDDIDLDDDGGYRSAYVPKLSLAEAAGDEEEEDEGEEEEGEGEEEGAGGEGAETTEAEPEAEIPEGERQFKLHPSLIEKFRPAAVQHRIEQAINEIIGDQEYSAADCAEWSKAIVNEILAKTKAMKFHRYKLVVQVTLGERRGQGATTAYRCLWDATSDCTATFTYTRDTLFCIGTVHAVYFY